MKFEEFIKTQKYELKEIKYLITKYKELEDCVIIYLDNSEKIKIAVDIYFKYNINSLKGIDENLYEILKYEENLYEAYKCALKKLSIKDYSIKQINDYLINNKKINNNESKIITDKLIEYGLLDDNKYCFNRINYLNRELLSYKFIRIKLIKEGINEELINKHLILDNKLESKKANQLASKYSKTIKNKSSNALKQNIINKLINNGFSYDVSKNALNSINISCDNEIILLKKEFEKAINKYSKKYIDYELKNYIYAHLINKGFKSNDIKKVMEELYG